MISRLIAIVCGVALYVATSLPAHAQLVRVGPFGGVNVRVPFAAVDVLPFGGGTRVRAPFTAVDTRLFALGYGRPYFASPIYGPALGYPPPIYPEPVYPAPVYPDVVYPDTDYVEPGAVYARPRLYRSVRAPVVDPLRLPQQLRDAAQRLAISLSARRDDGDVWLDYLGPQRIIEAVDRGASPDSLSDLLVNYQGVLGNPNLNSISGAPGFAMTFELLSHFIASAPVPAASPAQDADPSLVPAQPTPAVPPRPVPAEPVPAEPVPAEPVPAEPVPAEPEPESIEELPAPRPTEI